MFDMKHAVKSEMRRMMRYGRTRYASGYFANNQLLQFGGAQCCIKRHVQGAINEDGLQRGAQALRPSPTPSRLP